MPLRLIPSMYNMYYLVVGTVSLFRQYSAISNSTFLLLVCKRTSLTEVFCCLVLHIYFTCVMFVKPCPCGCDCLWWTVLLALRCSVGVGSRCARGRWYVVFTNVHAHAHHFIVPFAKMQSHSIISYMSRFIWFTLFYANLSHVAM